MQFIRAHAHQPIGVRDVLKAAHSSRPALEQKFRRMLHRTIMEEIRCARLDLALQLIADDSVSLNHIAPRCGLSTSTQLSQLTRRYLAQRRSSSDGVESKTELRSFAVVSAFGGNPPRCQTGHTVNFKRAHV